MATPLGATVAPLPARVEINDDAGPGPGLRTLLKTMLWGLLLTCVAGHAQQVGAVAPLPAPGPEPEISVAVPALEIVAFDFLLNRYNRCFSGSSDYDVTAASIRRNLRGPWVVDNDPFKVNQFAHPIQGSLCHGAGRATGLTSWEASALTFAGRR